MVRMEKIANTNSNTGEVTDETAAVQVDAIVLAGGDGSVIDPEISVKGLVEVAGKPMVQWVVEALRKAQQVREIAVVLPPGQDIEKWQDLCDYVVLSDGMISENVAAGVKALSKRGHVVVSTSDVPSVSPDAIDDMITQSLQRGADLSYPLIPEVAMLEAYPGTERTFFKLREGRVTGGNVMVFDSHQLEYLTKLGQEAFEARKNPFKLANIVGMRFAFKLAAGKLSMQDIEDCLNNFVGLKCAAILSNYASIGADVDKPEDIPVIEAKLAEVDKAHSSNSSNGSSSSSKSSPAQSSPANNSPNDRPVDDDN